MLSIFFAIGIFQLVQIQKLPEASKAGLDSFLFGKAAALVSNDLYILILT
jgi:manganese/zinc/iron transport system permease protein